MSGNFAGVDLRLRRRVRLVRNHLSTPAMRHAQAFDLQHRLPIHLGVFGAPLHDQRAQINRQLLRGLSLILLSLPIRPPLLVCRP